LIRRPKADDDEETSFIKRPSTVTEETEESSADTFARFNGYYYEKAAFDLKHDGGGEDVFDVRTKFGLTLEATSPSMVKAFLSARFSHYAVGEDAGEDETWYLYNSNNNKYEYEAELREAYVYIPNDVMNLRVGNQIVRWGFGNFNKPSDVLNPSDFREGLFSDLEAPLIPVFMVHADRNVGPVNLSLVWIPFFTPNRTHLFGNDWAPLAAMSGDPASSTMGGMQGMMSSISTVINPLMEDDVQPIILATHPPEERPENGQWGARAGFDAFGVDFSLSYFYGYDKLPWVHTDQQFFGDVAAVTAFGAANPDFLKAITNIDMDEPGSLGKMVGMMNEINDDPEKKKLYDAAMASLNRILYDENGNQKALDPAAIFSTHYNRQQTIGFSFAGIAFDTVGIRFDSAFSPSRTMFLESNAGLPEPASLPAFSYSVGLDYNRSSWFDVMAEFYHFHIFDVPNHRQVFIVGSDLYMTTLASHYRFGDFEEWEIQLAAMYEINGRGLFAFPKLSYKATDNLKLALGAIVVESLPGGDDEGPGGLFDRNDSAYADLKWSF